jgi:cellulose synthase/poly-beta-1,6-N-acetylglucosamine synthase-like glycosyltransferase
MPAMHPNFDMLRQVTVCIPVSRDSSFVRQILLQLAVQRFAGPVVLAWYADHLRRELDELAVSEPVSDLDVRLVRGGGHTAPILRNAAVATVTTPWCLFLDDDVVLDDGYVQALSEVLETEKNATAVQGAPFAAANNGSWFARCEAGLYAARLATYRDGATIRLCDPRNLLVRTAVANEVRFAEAPGLGSDGYILARRLLANSARIAYAEALAVRHHHRDSLIALARQKFRHGRGRVYVDGEPHPRARAAAPLIWRELLWRHAAGPLRYLWSGRMPLRLLPYALLTAAFFCAGMAWEISTSRFRGRS